MESLDKKALKEKQAKERKWYKMVKDWEGSKDETSTFPEELKSRIWQGCPNSLRGRVWPLMLRIKETKHINERKFGQHIYEVIFENQNTMTSG